MRPAYRYTLIVLGLLGLGSVAALSLWRPQPPDPAPEAATSRSAPGRPVRPAAADPGRVPEVLDQLEHDEAEALGEGKAAARRRQRELLIRERGGRLPEPEPEGGAAP